MEDACLVHVDGGDLVRHDLVEKKLLRAPNPQSQPMNHVQLYTDLFCTKPKLSGNIASLCF